MADQDITNQQLLNALTTKFDKRFDGLEQRFNGLESKFEGLEQRFDGLESRFDGLEQRFDGLEQRFSGLEEMLIAVKNVVTGIADSMATSKELTEFKEELYEDFDNLELRLGRRIDAALSTGKTTH